MGTLTLSISKSVHASISPIFLHMSCSIATLELLEPLLLENCVCIIALMPDLQRVSFYSVTESLHHSSIIDLLLPLTLIKGSYLSFKASPTMREIIISLVVAVACKFIHGRHANQYLESKQLTIFG
jgi:hypothetical protein